MAQIIVPSRRVWTRQPPGDVGLVDGVRFAFNPAAWLKEQAGGQLLTQRHSSLFALRRARRWVCADLTAHAAAGLVCSNNDGAGGVDFCSPSIFVFSIRPTTANGAFFSRMNTLGTTEMYAGMFKIGRSGTSLVVNYNDGTGIQTWTLDAGIASNVDTTIAIDVRRDKLVAYRDGRFIGANDWSMPPRGIYLSGGIAQQIGGDNNSHVGFAGHVYNIGVIEEGDARGLSENSWQIYRPRDRRAFIDVGASGTLSASASGSDTATGTATLQAQVALAGVGVSVTGGSAQGGVAVPLSAAAISVSGGSADGIATVSISAAGLAQAAGQAGLSASVLLAAAGAAQAAGNTTLAALLNAQAAGAGQASGSANLTGGAPGALSASGGDVVGGSAVLSVNVQLQATGAGQAGGSANGTASAPGALSAAGQANAAGFATWSALITLTAAGFVQAMGAGSFQVSIPLAAAGTAQASGVAQASLGSLVNRFALQAREKRVTEAAASVWRVALVETDVARLTRLVHEVKHV